VIAVADHPLLDLVAFVTRFAVPLGRLAEAPAVRAACSPAAHAPLASSEEVRKAVRDLLRRGGFKPTGRSKPSSEYLLHAADAGPLPAINPAVDACNAASLHSGLPISVVDLDRLRPPLRVAMAEPGSRYLFNPSGQEIDVGRLLCLHDQDGPCANAVKDAQRTKTGPDTTATLSLVWGTTALPGRAAACADWYRQLLEAAGGVCEPVALEREPGA
jgi:DNA/RNA-binding domain of Phe-tRNA-synthetase-like protein